MLNSEQKLALTELQKKQNVFLTGPAGTGKSYVLKHFLDEHDSERFPILASTGAAAILIGGRTFHSFFGLGILEGGPQKTIERAMKDRRVQKRLKMIEGFILDEVSMIPGVVLDTAEQIARITRQISAPWGGLKVVAVGDFFQLPPITQGFSRDQKRDWAFQSRAWRISEFKNIELKQMMRAKEDPTFCNVLEEMRMGMLGEESQMFLMEHAKEFASRKAIDGTILYARKKDVEAMNREKLQALKGKSFVFDTEYFGQERAVETLKKQAPIPEKLEVKIGALVMCRVNDVSGRFVNGSLGNVVECIEDTIVVKLLSGVKVSLERESFKLLDAEGKEIASARNFPLILAYAVTIHKSQGATLDEATMDLRGLWEPGQAYVALSRLKHSMGLRLEGWEPKSIFADDEVLEFYQTSQ